MSGGQLDANGSYLDQSGPPIGLDFVPQLVLIDDRLVFVLPSAALDGSISIEFDALAADGFTVISETSLVGSGPSPFWVSDTPQGTVLAVPPIERSSPLPDRLGGMVVSDITMAENFIAVSIWIYMGLENGTFGFANAKILKEELEALNPDVAEALNESLEEIQAETPLYSQPGGDTPVYSQPGVFTWRWP